MRHHVNCRGHGRFIALAMSTTALVMLSAVGCSSDRGAPVAHWEPPAQELLPSMEQPPVAGWRLKAVDVEPLAGHSASARYGFRDGPRSVDALVGAIGDHAYFLAAEEGSASSWWLVGIDVRRGSELFKAVSIATQPLPPRCFVNGDANVLCLTPAEKAPGDGGYTALVVNATSGDVVYSGPTKLRVGGATLAVRQYGTRAVAVTDRGGVFGIGSRAETTWSSPGVGLSGQPFTGGSIAFQEAIDPAGSAVSAFSLVDGDAIVPAVPPGATLRSALAYPGGFAAELALPGAGVGVGFFDDEGRRIGLVDDATLSSTSAGLPVLKLAGASQESVFDPLGSRMFDIPDHGGGVRLEGGTLFVNDETSTAFPRWRQYDLLTGEPGSACDFDMDDYLGTDGSLLVFGVSNQKAGLLARARDKRSCETVWTLPAAADSSADVWRIGDVLVGLSGDGGELRSLVPPS